MHKNVAFPLWTIRKTGAKEVEQVYVAKVQGPAPAPAKPAKAPGKDPKKTAKK